jgi:hypothetical protein
MKEAIHLKKIQTKAIIVQDYKREPIAYEEALFELDVTH